MNLENVQRAAVAATRLRDLRQTLADAVNEQSELAVPVRRAFPIRSSGSDHPRDRVYLPYATVRAILTTEIERLETDLRNLGVEV